MKEKIWIGNLVRPYSNTPRYMQYESENTIYFRTVKEKKEIAFLRKKEGNLYINKDRKMQFKRIINQIIKDYKPKAIAEYVDLF